MAKKTKDTTVTTSKTVSTGPPDPAKTKNLLRLLNTLAVLLSILAFLLQLFAVLSHYWKWQTTDLHGLISPNFHYSQPNLHNDARLDQKYGLYTRDVKIYGDHDEQLDILASTRFPRIEDDDTYEDKFHQCLSQTKSLRGAILTCSNRVNSLEPCSCRRYAYWNWVIFLEIAALVLLGIVVFLTALLGTQFQALLKPIAAVLALLAFIFLLVGLILICTHLKRETRSLSDAYPHIHQRVTNQLNLDANQQRYPTALRRAVRQTSAEHYRMYQLGPDEQPYNTTHYYASTSTGWVLKSYASRFPQGTVYVQPSQQQQAPVYVQPLQQQERSGSAQRRSTAAPAPVLNRYGPALGYEQVYDHTNAGLGLSTILSILSMIPALLVPLLLIYSWLTGKKSQPATKKDYTAVSTQEVTAASRQVPSDYSATRPVGDAFATTHHPPSNFGQHQPGSVQQGAARTVPTDYSINRPAGDVFVTTHHPPSNFGQQQQPGSIQQVSARQIPVDYNPNRPTGDAYVTTHHPAGSRGPVAQTTVYQNPDRPAPDVQITQSVRQGPQGTQGGQTEPIVVHDVIIPSDSRA